MDNVLAKITAVKEKIIFGGIIIFTLYILIGIFTCAIEVTNNTSASSALVAFGKFLPTILMMGICFLCFIDNLNKISNKNTLCRIFAIISMVVIPFFLILYCLGAWELVKFTECAKETTLYGYSYCTHEALNAFGKITAITGSLASLGTIGALTMSIKSHNRKVIDISKIIAASALTIAIILSLYLALKNAQFLYLYVTSTEKADSITLFAIYFCLIAWLSLVILAFYLSKFDNGVAPTPIKPLNAKVVSASAPAVLTIEEVKDEKPETIYPEPTNTPIHHVDGVILNAPAPKEKPEETPAPKPEKPETIMPEEHHDDAPLHASPGEPLFEEHPTIGPATSGTSHDVFDSLDSQENENKEVL